jgi:RNA polymerase sigma-70 factor (sigma-E family)
LPIGSGTPVGSTLNLPGGSGIGTVMDTMPIPSMLTGERDERPVRSRSAPGVDHEFVTAFVDQQAAVLRLATLLCGGDRRQAEDVVAEAFARTYPQWRKGHVEHLAAYLRTVVVNEVARRGRRRVLEQREAARRTVPAQFGPTAAEHVADRDLVMRALMTLPPRQRAVVVLRFYDDRTETDIAAVLGVSVGTVKSQLSRALDRLRPLVSAALDHEDR